MASRTEDSESVLFGCLDSFFRLASQNQLASVLPKTQLCISESTSSQNKPVVSFAQRAVVNFASNVFSKHAIEVRVTSWLGGKQNMHGTHCVVRLFHSLPLSGLRQGTLTPGISGTKNHDEQLTYDNPPTSKNSDGFSL